MVIPGALAPAGPGAWRLRPLRPGPPDLVLLPGIIGDGRVFLRQAPLARRRAVLALDLPADPSPPPSLRALAARLLARIPAERFVVMGASLGGLLAWAMSLEAPDRVRGIVTLGALPGAHLRPPGLARQRRLMTALPGPVFRALYRRRIAARLAEEGVAPEVARLLLGRLPAQAVLAGRLRLVERWGLGAPPPVPALWLLGQHDREVGWGTADVTRALPRALVQVVPGGHRAHLTHPGALHGFVEHFLRGVPP